MSAPDAIVVGAGLLGAAVAYGLARKGVRPLVLDEGEGAFRASRGNFGLVWVQGKGDDSAPYARWTQASAILFPDLAAELEDLTGVPLTLDQPGGIHICLSEADFEARAQQMAAAAAQPGSRLDYEMLGPNALARYLPGLGPDVVGGSWSAQDGQCDPLRLLRALHAGILAHGGRIETGARVARVAPDGGGFRVEAARTHRAPRVVLAAGLGNRTLAPMLGLRQPVYPLKGQVLVTERVDRFLDIPTTHIRQTADGTVMIGDSQEDAGFDIASAPAVMRAIADRARRTVPALARVQVVRAWAALRVMTPDGLPVYQTSAAHPGAAAISCHSGVTLAAAHALRLAPMLAQGRLEGDPAALGPDRFPDLAPGGPDVQAA
ncbi:MAG: FAD-dependent oxidoreductase [Pseudomonadota bacterium]